MFIFYALFYLSDSLNNKHVSFTLSCLLPRSLFDWSAADFIKSYFHLKEHSRGLENILTTKYI